uniref:Integrase catalytic domain-containing protein n=1 Tax=Tanacetum cinerariifolium TaxID=118510 RepID=A0A6L2LLN1_TANCI|nr:hypothetical protein [Tanacetum cinerariifolium]
MKMKYWIMNTDHNLWKVIQNGNSKKSLGRDLKGGIIILPPVSFEEYVAVQREMKAKTLLLQSLPEDHMDDIHHLDDAREIWLAVKAQFGGNEESKKMRKTMLKQEFFEFRVSKEEGFHKGYDRFQKILSQLNQIQAKLDNDDVNLKFLKALPPSWSQVTLTLKTRGGLEYLSFDDLYNKLRSLEIDVKGGSSYGSRGTAAPTHSAFIGATRTTTKMGYSDPPSHSSSITYTSAHSGSLIEDVDQMDMEELDIKWQMAMLSLRINKFQKKVGRKINFNNKDSARFDRKKARCYNCLQLKHFARECNVKKVDEKAQYSAFKILKVKTKEPKAMVYGLMAGFKSDFADPGVNAAGSVYDAAAEFAMMGISPKAKIEKKEWEVKLVESLARFDKWKASSKNLAKLINSSMTTRTKLGLGFMEYFGLDEVFDLSTPSIFNPEPVTRESPTSINTSDSNDFISCDNSDKSLESETHDFASCVSSPMPADSFSTVDVKILPKFDVKDPSPTNGVSSCSIKENVKPPSDLCNKRRIASRNNYNNNFVRTKTYFVYGSKSHLIKDCHVYDTVDNFPSVVLKAALVPAGSRNSSASTSAGRSIPATSRNRPASIHAGRHTPAGRSNKPTPFLVVRTIPTGWINHAARPFFEPTNLCFDNVYWPGIYNHMSMNEGRRGSAVHPHVNKDIDIVNSGCSRSITGNKDKHDDFVQVKGGTVTFGGGDEAVSTACYVLNRVSITNPHNKTPYELLSRNIPNIRHLKLFGCQVTIWENLKGKLMTVFLLDMLLIVQMILTSLQDVSAPMENNLDYAEELAQLQRKEYEAHSAAARHGFEFFVDTAALLPQVNIEIHRKLVLAGSDPASSVPTGGVLAGSSIPANSVPTGGVLVGSSIPASSVLTGGVLAGSSIPASSVPIGEVFAGCSIPASSKHAGGDLAGSSVPASDVLAGSFSAGRVPAGGVLAGSLVSTDSGASSVHAVSVLVPAVVFTDSAATSPFPLVYSLGSCAHTTRFPSPSDLRNHQHTAGIFSSSSYDDDFCADVSNLDLNVVVDPVATRRINFIHPQSHILGDLQSLVQTRKPSSVANALADPDWVAAMQEEMQWFYYQQVWKLVPLPAGKIAIGTKWILKNKRDARGIVVYVDDIIFGSTNKAWCDEFEVLMEGEFEMSAMGELTFFLGLQVKQLPDGIFISQDKYVKDMLKKFDMESVRTATTPYEVPKNKLKDEPDDAINVYLFRSMIGSLMYLTASRPDIMFALEAYSDSDYAGSHGDRKSTTGRCQFLGRQLILWQCKKQIVVATSSTEAEYVAAASCCGYVLWIQNQMLDYGFNFMHTRIFIDNQSTICIVKNLVFHQRTKHIEIQHHFIRDAYEKNLIQVRADDLVSAGGSTLPAGSYSFLLLDWFLLVVLLVHADVFVYAEPMVHPAESPMDPPLTAPAHSSSEPTVIAPTPLSSRHRRKHIAKKRVTPIVDVADAAMIKFNSDSDSDDDPLPYAPYAGWEMVPSPLGSVHAYHSMAGNTKHFTTLRDILHMVERTDLQSLLMIRMLFISGVLKIVGAFAAGDYIHGHKFMDGSPWFTAKKELTRHEGTALSWLVQEQTTLCKDESNPLTVGSLLKTIWSSIHHLLTDEVLTSPEQTATDQMLLSHDPAVLGVPTGFVLLLFESDCKSLPSSNLYDRFQPSGGYHVVPPSYTGTFMPPKPDLVFNTAPTTVETDHLAFNVQLSPPKSEQDLSPTSRPSAPIIKEWAICAAFETTILAAATTIPASPKSNSSGKRRSRKACFVCKSMDHLIKDCNYHTKQLAQPTPRNYAHRGHHKQYAPLTHSQPQKHRVPTAVLTQSKPFSNTAVRPISAALPNITVTRPRNAHQVVTKFKSLIRRHITRSPSSRTSNLPLRVIAVQALVVSAIQGNPQLALHDKGVIDSGCSRSDNGTEFKNSDLNQFCGLKGIKREFSVPRTPQQNGIDERKNQNLIEAARTMLADLLLPIPFWAEAVTTACYVDEGFLVGYSVCSKAFRVFNSRTRIIQETLHVNFLENKPNVAGTGPSWLFNIDSLTRTMNYQPVHAGNQTNSGVGFQDNFDAEKEGEEVDQSYMLFPIWSVGFTNPQNNTEDAAFDGKEHDVDVKKPESKVILSPSSGAQSKEQDDKTMKEAKGKSPVESVKGYRDLNVEFQDCSKNSSNKVTTASSIVLTVGKNSLNSTNTFSAAELEDIIYSDDEDVVGVEADFNNLESSIPASPIPTTRIHKDHHVSQIIGDLSSTTQTRSMTRAVKDQSGLSQMFDTDFHTCMFACFFSQEEPKRVHQDLKDPSWIEAMQEELLQFKMQKVFAPVARIEAIRLFLAYASFMGFMVYQMDVKSAFLYGTIEEEVYVCQPPGFEDPDHSDKVYKVGKALYGLHQAPRAWYETLATYLLKNSFHRDDIIFGATNKDLCKSFEKLMKDKFQMSSIGELTFFLGLQCKKQTVVATSSTEAEYIAAASYCAQVLWIQNQLLDYGHKLLLFSLTNWCCSISAVSYIKYALTINRHIYVSCIKQFWNTAVVKQTNDVTRLQAFVDKKKVVIIEDTIRDALHLDDAKGVDCLPNEEICVELARIGRKFNFSKYIFRSLVRNVDISSKFYMYPRFIQLIIQNQLGDISTHTTKYISPALTQKVFANMRRVGKGFSRVETPLFEGMLVGVIEEGGDAEEQVQDVAVDTAAQGADTAVLGDDVQDQSIPFPTPSTPPPQQSQDLPSTSQEALDACVALTRRVDPLEYDKVAQALEITKLKRKVKKLERRNKVKVLKLRRDTGVALMDDKEDEKKAEEANVFGDDQVKGRKVVDVVTTAKLITEVVTAASKSVTAASTIITAAEPQVPAATITYALVRVVAASTRRRKGVVIKDPEEESTTIIPTDTKSKDKGKGIMVEEPKPLRKKQHVEMDKEYARKLHKELNKDIDWNVAVDHVKQKAKEDPFVQRYQVMKKRPQTEAQARRNMIMYLKNVTGFRLDYFKGMSYKDIRPIFEAKFNSNIEFLLKSKEQLEEEENRVIQSINKTPAQKAAKRRKLNEEVKDLKQHLEIMPGKDDDVYTEATSLARKVPVVDYEIIHVNNKPHYKIIRANGTHQLYVSFITLLKNFDREDLESLWSLVKERFSTSKPNNFSDDYLLTTLGAMFERPDRQAQVYKRQRSIHGQAKVKSWKLLESCGVYIITFTTTQLILLVERRYPLSRFTLDQMLNAVRLRVEDQSEMSLKLLRFTRQQHQEGQLE